MNKEDKSAEVLNFEPPKLPFKWLATTFIAPVLVIILPNIIVNQEVTFEHRLIAALTLLSVMLFVSCIIAILQTYNRAYELQALKLGNYLSMRDLEHIKHLYSLTGIYGKSVYSVAQLVSEIEKVGDNVADPKLTEALESLKSAHKQLEEALYSKQL